MSARLNVTDSRLDLLCHNSGQEHFYQVLNTEPWCLSELLCRQFRTTCMLLDWSPLKWNKCLTMTLLKCCYERHGIECTNTNEAQIKMNVIALVFTLIWVIYRWQCQLGRIKAAKAPGSRCHWLQAQKVLHRPAGWNWSAHVQNRAKSHSCEKDILPGPCEGLLYPRPAAVKFFHSPPRHTSSSACCTHILLLISNYFNI